MYNVYIGIMDEVWRDIEDIVEEDGSYAYQVSNLGNVRRAKPVVSAVKAANMGTSGWSGSYTRVLKPAMLRLNKAKTKSGKQRYVFVSIKDHTYTVHRLVAKAFLPDTYKDGMVVNHKDGNKHNNCVENLEWCTKSENEQHSYDVLGKQVWNKGKSGYHINSWSEERKDRYVERNKNIMEDRAAGMTTKQLAEKYGICTRYIQQIIKENNHD